ncbi:MAG: hypothetical protein KAI57_04380 [Candidatus Pacebacteria bacterium]|nr:hypothetical protein [Candidatus Paceibacterota bacterium]
MTTMFESIEDAKNTIATMTDVDSDTFEEVPDLHVYDVGTMLLSNPDISTKTKELIQKRIECQKGFKFKDKNKKEVKIVIGPFRSGFDCWILGEGESAYRI